MSVTYKQTLSINSYNDVKDRLRVRIMDYEPNKKKFEDLIYGRVSGGFALVPYMILDEISDGAVANITNGMAQAMCVDRFTIIKNAMAESEKRNPPVLRRLADMLSGKLTRNLLSDGMKHNIEPNELLVLTIDDGILGASALYYPDTMEKISKVIGGDYYVLPSSVHEVLILPATSHITEQELLSMVWSVNSTVVSREDELASRVLMYDAGAHQLVIVADDGWGY